VGRTAERSAALARTVLADATQWETDIGTTIGVAITATGITGRTNTHTVEAPAGDGHLRVVSGCAVAATATARPTAIIEDGVIVTVGAVLARTAAGSPSAERKRQMKLTKQLSGTRCRRGPGVLGEPSFDRAYLGRHVGRQTQALET
jgi:hypothetical protein